MLYRPRAEVLGWIVRPLRNGRTLGALASCMTGELGIGNTVHRRSQLLLPSLFVKVDGQPSFVWLFGCLFYLVLAGEECRP